MKLMELLFEDDENDKTKPKAKKKQPTKVAKQVKAKSTKVTPKPASFKSNSSIPSLSQLAKQAKVPPESEPEDNRDPALKGLPNLEPKPFDDGSDFKMPQPKKPYEPSRFAPKSKEKSQTEPESKPKLSPREPNTSIPSLSQLAKQADSPEEKPDTREPALRGLPNFDDIDQEEPDFGKPASSKTILQKTTDKLGQGLKKGVQAIGQGIQKGRDALNKIPGQIPKNWKPGKAEIEPQSDPQSDSKEDDKPMPSMSNIATKNHQGLQGKHWKWKPGQKVDIGFIKDLTVINVDQYGAKLKSKNGGIFRFVPHRRSS